MKSVHPLIPADQVLEIVSPRTNTALLSAAEHFFAALTVQSVRGSHQPVALEIAADAGSRRFLARCSSAEEARRLIGLVGSAYPQADVRVHDSASLPTADPAGIGPDEQVAACTLGLRSAAYLPLRIFEDHEIDAS